MFELIAQVDGGDEEFAVFDFGGVSGEVVEEVGAIFADGFVAGEQTDIGVELRGDRVVIAGGEVHVAADAVFFLADDERGLAVDFEVEQSVDNVDTLTLQLSGPFDVALFVEAGFEFDQDGDLLPIVDGFEESFDDGRVVANAIESDLDGEDVGIARGLLEEGDDGLE